MTSPRHHSGTTQNLPLRPRRNNSNKLSQPRSLPTTLELNNFRTPDIPSCRDERLFVRRRSSAATDLASVEPRLTATATTPSVLPPSPPPHRRLQRRCGGGEGVSIGARSSRQACFRRHKVGGGALFSQSEPLKMPVLLLTGLETFVERELGRRRIGSRLRWRNSEPSSACHRAGTRTTNGKPVPVRSKSR
jgi:hypothetical protein